MTISHTTCHILLRTVCGSLLLLHIGCEQPQTKREYIARVGDAYLTRQAIEALGDSGLLQSPVLLRTFVNRWVDTELLYQEARRQGVENTEQFRQQLADVRKQLAVEALLTRELYADTVTMLEDSIRSYFRRHADEFLLQNDVVKINMATFSTWEHANAFRRMLTRGRTWASAIEEMVKDPAASPSIVSHVQERYYTQQTLVPAELWRVASNIGRSEVSFPVKVHNVYAIIQTLSILKRGAPAELDLVQDEIRQRLEIGQRRQRYAELLNRLHSQFDVEITAP